MANFYGGVPGPQGKQGEQGTTGPQGPQGLSIKEVRLQGQFNATSSAKNTYEIIDSENNVIGTFDIYNGAEGQLEGQTIPVILTEYIDNPTNEKVYSADYINDNLITNAGLEGKGYLTDQDLSDYATKDEIPDVTNFATKDEIPSLNDYAKKSYVQKQIETIEIPSLEGYAKTEDLDSYVTKTAADTDYVAKDQVVATNGIYKARGTCFATAENWSTMGVADGQIVWVYG